MSLFLEPIAFVPCHFNTHGSVIHALREGPYLSYRRTEYQSCSSPRPMIPYPYFGTEYLPALPLRDITPLTSVSHTHVGFHCSTGSLAALCSMAHCPCSRGRLWRPVLQTRPAHVLHRPSRALRSRQSSAHLYGLLSYRSFFFRLSVYQACLSPLLFKAILLAQTSLDPCESGDNGRVSYGYGSSQRPYRACV
ncbi:hypothetical protein LZ30DRAFT_438766 [Colletotrichum cereale]|nr:hypothetical protein LZ30DRAFT_438766 [Colletotrichum cereale]